MNTESKRRIELAPQAVRTRKAVLWVTLAPIVSGLAQLSRAEPVMIDGALGTQIAAEAFGDASNPEIVFVHGWSQGRELWTKQVEFLRDDFRVVTYDLRGHGDSEKPLDPSFYARREYWAEDLKTVVDHFELRKPIIVGWSFGTYPSLDYLNFFGTDDVAGLVLVGANTHFQTPTGESWWGPVTADAFFDSGPLDTDGKRMTDPDQQNADVATEAFVNGMHVSGPWEPADFDHALAVNLKTPPEIRSLVLYRDEGPASPGFQGQDLGNNDSYDNNQMLMTTDLPVAIIHCEEDPVVVFAAAEYTANLNNDFHLYDYDDVGHIPFIETQSRFNADLTAFVNNIMADLLDCNHDDQVDVDDADLLVRKIARGPFDKSFDFTRDGLLNEDDLHQWLNNAARTNDFSEAYLPGDANLDGTVNSADLNSLALKWRHSVANWSGGDFTADGVVDSVDLNRLAQNWRRSIPRTTAVNASVPEPTGLLLALVGLALVWRRLTRG